MLNLLDFLSGIADGIVAVFDFIISLFSDFMTFLQLVAKLPSYLFFYLSWLPTEILTPLLLLFGIVILYKILGREG